MKKSITVFKLVSGETAVTLSTNKQALEHQKMLEVFGVTATIEKEKKVIEL